MRLLEQLLVAEKRVSLIVSSYGLRLLATEADISSTDDLRVRVGGKGWDKFVTLFTNDDRDQINQDPQNTRRE